MNAIRGLIGLFFIVFGAQRTIEIVSSMQSLDLPLVVPNVKTIWGVFCAPLLGFVFVFYAAAEHLKYRKAVLFLKIGVVGSALVIAPMATFIVNYNLQRIASGLYECKKERQSSPFFSSQTYVNSQRECVLLGGDKS